MKPEQAKAVAQEIMIMINHAIVEHSVKDWELKSIHNKQKHDSRDRLIKILEGI